MTHLKPISISKNELQKKKNIQRYNRFNKNPYNIYNIVEKDKCGHDVGRTTIS